MDILESLARDVVYLDPAIYQRAKEAAQQKFGGTQSYVRNLWTLRWYKSHHGRVKYKGGKSPSENDIKNNLKQEHKNKIKNESKSSINIFEDLLKEEENMNNEPLSKTHLKLDQIFTSMAAVPADIAKPTNGDIDNLHRRIDFLNQRLTNNQDDNWQKWHEHNKGHLPPISSPGQMNSVLKKLGLDEDYACAPKTIYASDGSIKEILLSFTPKNK